ncbi:hypothetical protein LDENG_00255190 [Lucifuga dentata]|nr:hypothetical protein LDENG_00255190 [Lucifuga dentata]
MNGAVYISFFQGQLESVLEQVVQLAVQEISKSVGSNLNALLLETAVKEQENSRLKLQLQSREGRGRAAANGTDTAAEDGGERGGHGSPVAGKNKADKATTGDDSARRTKPELQLYAPGGPGTEPGVPADTRRREQRGRAVGKTPRRYTTRRHVHSHKACFQALRPLSPPLTTR